MTNTIETLYGRDIEPGMHIYVNADQSVTVADVTRRDSKWVSGGVVYFTATNGRSYSFPRNEPITFA